MKNPSIRAPWAKYLGMPYMRGGHPERDGCADCFSVVIAVLDMYQRKRPAINQEWYQAAERGEWKLPLAELHRITATVPGSRFLDIALMRRGAPIALGICVAGGVLTATQENGVIWQPLAYCDVKRWFVFSEDL